MMHPSTLLAILRHKLRILSKDFNRLIHRSMNIVKLGSSLLEILAFIASVGFVVCAVILGGYKNSATEISSINHWIRVIQGVFITNILYSLLFRFRFTVQESKLLKWIFDIAVLITALPWIYPRPEHPWIPFLDAFLYSKIFLYTALGAYSALTVSIGIMKCIGKRTNPSLLLSGSFLVFIIIGSFLLMLPESTYVAIDYTDALFVSTSAVCITGLTPVDVSLTFTPLGIGIILVLMQIGALGVMTFTSFFALFFSGGGSIYNQLLLKDIFYSKSMNALVPTLLYILGFTVTVEIIGAVAIYLSIAGTIGSTFYDEIIFSIFHSVSSFCNAGFSILPNGMSSPLLLYGNISIYWITTILILAGAIGFPILVNFKDAIVSSLKRIWLKIHHRKEDTRNIHQYSMNTKIVLVTFFALFFFGAVAFWLLERNNSLCGMTLPEQITQSVFNSAVPRSAGFSSVNPAGFLNVTIMVILILMWIGGASQSTAGGIKVNTFAAILLNLRAIITGRTKISAFRRNISVFSIRRANAVVTLSILSYCFYSVTLLILEPDLPVKALLFEASSALFTVGSSLGVTNQLSAASEVLLCTAMFLGRVGIISLLVGLAGRHHDCEAYYPSGNIIIN
ncbi:MAG: potassium transporter [Paramuribaculum sp.]|nr:potassium transporter [Paramuribaculum sp.]